MISLIRFIDRYILGIVSFVVGLLPARKEPHNEEVLAIQLWGVGETILTLPALSELKNVTVLVTSRNKDVYEGIHDYKVLSMNPFKILLFVLRNWNTYGTVIDFEEYLNISSLIAWCVGRRRVGFDHGFRAKLYSHVVYYNPEIHCSETFMHLLGPLGIKKRVVRLVPLRYSHRDSAYVDKLLKVEGVDKKHMVVFGVGVAESAKSRIWPIDRFSELANKLMTEKNMQIVFVGIDADKEIIAQTQEKIPFKTINLCSKFSLAQVAYLLSAARLVVSNDTGTMHIATCMGAPTIGLFGPNLPERFGPLNGVGVYEGKNCDRSPCINVHKGEVPDCYYTGDEYQKCMKNISVDEVYGKAKELL